MPSPTWSTSGGPLLTAAIAAATHHAWEGPERGRQNRFLEALRQMIGPEWFERVELKALILFQMQPAAPEGFELPPEWAWFQICPGCQKLRRTKHTAAQHRRVKLEVLRDRQWLQEQFERGRSVAQIAAELDCSVCLVRDWARKHNVLTPRVAGAREFDAEVRRRHYDGEAPGTIAEALDTTVQLVRKSLLRQRIANGKSGHHYFAAEWWRVRMVDQGMTKLACSREAGIRPHAATHFIKKFGLTAYTMQNGKRRNRRRIHPILHDAEALGELLARHTTYQAAAKEVGCFPTALSRAARELLGAPKRGYPMQLPHSVKSWWVERLDAGRTIAELAAEAGIQENSAREWLRVRDIKDRSDLLGQAYRNEFAAERKRRRVKEAA